MYVDTNRALGVGTKVQQYTLENNNVNGLDIALNIALLICSCLD